MSDATFACPDLTTFTRLDELGLDVVGQRLEPDRAVLACRVVAPDGWCRRCGCEGARHDTVTRRLWQVEPFTAFADGPKPDLLPSSRTPAGEAPRHQGRGARRAGRAASWAQRE